MVKNLGQISAISIGTVAPTNTSLIWFDQTTSKHKFYNTNTLTWDEVAPLRGFEDDGDFVDDDAYLSFDNGGVEPSIGDVFILKETLSVSGYGSIYIKINGESFIELVDVLGNNIENLLANTSYMIMKVDDFRDVSTSILSGEEVYVLLGSINSERTKCENSVSLTIDDFDGYVVNKIFALPINCENIILKGEITQTFHCLSINNIKLFSSSSLNILYQDALNQISIDNFIKTDDTDYGMCYDGDILYISNPKLQFRGTNYTFLQLVADDHRKDRLDTGAVTLSITFEYPSKMV